MKLAYDFGHSIEVGDYRDDYVDDGEFYYDVTPTEEDYIEYLMQGICPPKGLTKEQAKLFQDGAVEAFQHALNDFGLEDEILDSDDFYDYMTAAYEEDAMREMEENYDDYD